MRLPRAPAFESGGVCDEAALPRGPRKGLPPSPSAQSRRDACPRHRGSPKPARRMWSSDPTGQTVRRRSGAIKAVTTCGDRTAWSTCQGACCWWWWWARGALVISSSGPPAPRSDSLDALDRGEGGGAGAKEKGFSLSHTRTGRKLVEALVRGPDRLAGHVTRPSVSRVRVKTGVRGGLVRRRRAGRRPGGAWARGRRRRGAEEAVGPCASVA